MRLRTIALIPLFGWGLCAGDARAQEGPTVAIVDFGSFMMGEGGASVSIGKATSAMLVADLSNRQDLDVIDRKRLRALLRDHDFHARGRLEEADAIEIGRLLRADYVLHGQITSIVDNLRLDVRAVDVETSAVVGVVRMSDKTTELPAVIARLADEFTSALGLPATAQRPAPASIPVRATIEFSHGLDAEDRGAVDEAARRYEATLEIHPEHVDAAKAVARLRTGS